MTVATLSFTRSLPVKQMGHRHSDFASTGTSKGVITTVVVCPSCPTCSLTLSVSSQCLSEASALSTVTVQQSLHPQLVCFSICLGILWPQKPSLNHPYGQIKLWEIHTERIWPSPAICLTMIVFFLSYFTVCS